MHSEERWIAGDFTTDMSISVVLSECLYLWARGSTERGGGVARRLHECTIPNNRLMVESHVCVEYNVNHSKSSTEHNSRQTVVRLHWFSHIMSKQLGRQATVI